MTELLERAFSEAAKFPPTEQGELAERWLAELESEHRWHDSSAATQNELALTANQALKEHAAGLTT